jgi:hypothetical protein
LKLSRSIIGHDDRPRIPPTQQGQLSLSSYRGSRQWLRHLDDERGVSRSLAWDARSRQTGAARQRTIATTVESGPSGAPAAVSYEIGAVGFENYGRESPGRGRSALSGPAGSDRARRSRARDPPRLARRQAPGGPATRRPPADHRLFAVGELAIVGAMAEVGFDGSPST